MMVGRGGNKARNYPHAYESRLYSVLERLRLNFTPVWKHDDFPFYTGSGSGYVCYLPDYNIGIVFSGEYKASGESKKKKEMYARRNQWYEEHGISVLTLKRNLDAPTMELIIRRRLKNEKSIG